MANHASHAGLPYCVKGARYTIMIPYLDADGDPTDPTTPDTEISTDGGAFADCAEEATTISGSNGSAYLTLSGAETNCSMARLAAKVASGPKATLIDLKPRVLPVIGSGTAQAGSASSLTLAAALPATPNLYLGCILKTTGGTGGGGTGGANNQARVITGYSSGRVATVSPNWETTPDNTTTFEVLLTEAALFRYAEVKGMDSDVITSSALATSAVTEIQAGLATASGVTDVYNRIGAPSGASLAADVGAVHDYVGTVEADVANVQADVTTIVTAVDTEVAAIKAKTDNLPANPASQTKLDTLHDTRIPGVIQPQTGDSYARLGAPAGASVSADIAAVKADTDKGATIYDDMTEDDGGTRRFTANALEQAPGGSGATPQLLVDTTVAGLTSQTVFTLTAGPTIDDALNNQTLVLYDASGANNPSVRKILDYVGATKTVTIDAAPGFTLVAGDGAKVFVTAAGATAPTEAQVADAVLDAMATQKVTIDRSTGEVTRYEADGTTPRGTVQLQEISADVVGYVPV